MKKEMNMQGDVQIITSKLPRSAKKVEKKPIALGEVSGHQHVVTGDYELFEDEKSNIYVVVGEKGAMLQHIHQSFFKGYDVKETLPVADHKAIELLPNTTYLTGIHKRYDPFKKVWERVID